MLMAMAIMMIVMTVIIIIITTTTTTAAVVLVTVAVRSEAGVLADRLLGSWVRIPLKAWMSVCVFLCCVVLCR
jgi:hypothetical protein